MSSMSAGTTLLSMYAGAMNTNVAIGYEMMCFIWLVGCGLYQSNIPAQLLSYARVMAKSASGRRLRTPPEFHPLPISLALANASSSVAADTLLYPPTTQLKLQLISLLFFIWLVG